MSKRAVGARGAMPIAPEPPWEALSWSCFTTLVAALPAIGSGTSEV
jgi:hypothetical protein